MHKEKQKILIIGSGGREHAIGWKVSQSDRVGEIFFASGNAGTASLGKNLDISATDIPKLIEFAKKEKIDLTLALPDDPLALGIVDAFKAENLRIWGPTKAASELEWSKAYAKDFMKRQGIPTAKYQVFTDYEQAKIYVDKGSLPVVIKASGLALGKGVTVAQTKEEAVKTLEQILINKIFGNAGNEVVIEEYLEGTEISIHAISDGTSWQIFPASQDHKRIFDGNVGPNTGGMGTIAPLPFVDSTVLARIEKEIIGPAILGMKKEGRPFVGILYPGIMLTKDGPKVFEFNARFGDPETQTYMRLLDTDLLDIVDASIDGRIADLKIKWKENTYACNIAIASGGYPGSYQKGKMISGMEEAQAQPDIIVFHAGTKIARQDLAIITNGGRVLGISATGNTLEETIQKAYKAIEKISFEGMQYRKDIGKSALKINKI
ncbi:MAG: phosphoribosylamine--glycine ligase [Patescibacteria group bacterium]